MAPIERSYAEEWARRQVLREDVERDLRLRESARMREREERFRDHHPWLARVWYGRA